jgi:hypothetical protein
MTWAIYLALAVGVAAFVAVTRRLPWDQTVLMIVRWLAILAFIVWSLLHLRQIFHMPIW